MESSENLGKSFPSGIFLLINQLEVCTCYLHFGCTKLNQILWQEKINKLFNTSGCLVSQSVIQSVSQSVSQIQTDRNKLLILGGGVSSASSLPFANKFLKVS